MIITVVGGVA